MSEQDRAVSIHPYFRVSEGQMKDFTKLCEQCVGVTATEPECLYYGFSFSGNEVFCREGYESAEGLLAHLTNVDPVLKEMLKISELTRLEVHGPADELAKLAEPLSGLKPAYFTLRYGIRR
jgi:quinol monooxygenase YgiN